MATPVVEEIVKQLRVGTTGYCPEAMVSLAGWPVAMETVGRETRVS